MGCAGCRGGSSRGSRFGLGSAGSRFRGRFRTALRIRFLRLCVRLLLRNGFAFALRCAFCAGSGGAAFFRGNGHAFRLRSAVRGRCSQRGRRGTVSSKEQNYRCNDGKRCYRRNLDHCFFLHWCRILPFCLFRSAANCRERYHHTISWAEKQWIIREISPFFCDAGRNFALHTPCPMDGKRRTPAVFRALCPPFLFHPAQLTIASRIWNV